MPVVKVPVQHKFGIVSLSRAEQLLARSSHRKEQKTKVRSIGSPPTHELNQAFIIKYNSAIESEREVLDTVVIRALHHARYKAGLSCKEPPPSHSPVPTFETFSDNSDIDVSGAWLELTLLCQCYGQHQLDVLVVLATSLNHSPLSTTHIPSLFYIAGLCYQWLKSDVLSSDLLRSGELLLLKVLYLVSIRMLYHHLTGALINGCTTDEVRQFKFDLEGFENRERTYRNFPEALLHWKVALEIGLLVCEAYTKVSHHHNTVTPSQISCSFTYSNSVAPTNTGPDLEQQISQETEPRESQVEPPTMTTQGHTDLGLSPILWHALDIWQCTKQGYESLQEAIEDLVSCSTDFDINSWIEGMLAMNILCVASESMIDVLHLVQILASGSVKQYYLDEERESSANQQAFVSKSARECLTKCSGTVTPTDSTREMAADLKKGTRFTVPPSAERKVSLDGNVWKGKDSILSRDMKSVKTLNILGMQPDFSESLVESTSQMSTDSVTTEDYDVTVSASNCKHSEENNIKHQQSHFDGPSSSEILLPSVRTQSLIENESIPETPPSQYSSSNTTVLELGSSSTLEAPVSNCKSVGLLASGNSYSKNLGMSISNVLSTAIMSRNPSGDIQAIGEDCGNSVSSLIPVQRKLVSPVSGLLADYGQEANTEDLSTVRGVASPQCNHQDNQTKDSQQVNEIRCQGMESQYTHYTHSSAPLSDGAGVPGSQAPPSTIYRRSTLSTPATELPKLESSVLLESSSKFENWPNEIALAYTLNMSSIVIFGKSSIIQKIALEGLEQKSSKDQQLAPHQKYGLLQLVDFNKDTVSETDPAINSLNSWSIQHGAVLGLSRICQAYSNLPMKEGLSHVAWSKLMERQSTENDARVIEAYKVSKACSDLDKPMLMAKSQSYSSPLFAHIANGLSQLFLPPITPAPDAFKLSKKNAKPRNAMPSVRIRDTQIKNVSPRVVTHFESKKVTPSKFTSRTMGALNKIAEEHWKRQMKQEEAEQELEKQQEEQRLQKEYDDKMKKKAEKLGRRKPKHH